MYRKLLLILFVTGPILLWSQAEKPLRVLFVGNSYTYFWNLPQSVQAMADAQGMVAEVRQSTAGGANLGQHWRGEKDLLTREKISKGNYDIVVLQDHSRRAVDHPDSLQIYGGRFMDLIKRQGGKPLLYMTWARDWDPFMFEPIIKEYQKLAKEEGADIAPIGKAWQLSLELRPDLALYDPDGSHPSPSGTYLNACVMYAVLFDRSPLGLPARLTTHDQNGELLYLNIQSQENATFLQKVAWEVVRELISDQ